MKRYKFVFLAFSIVLSSTSFASLKTVTKEVEGYGITRAEAIQDALIEAIKQTKGVAIDSQKEFAKQIKELSKSKDGESLHKVDIATLSTSRVKELTKGLINSYDILEAEKVEGDKEWRALVAVHLSKYESPGLKVKRRRLAILPFWGRSTYSINGKTVPLSEMTRRLNQELNNELIQARKFAVLDRTFVDEVASEKKLIKAGETPVAELAKLGETLGTDYLVVGTIENASFDIKKETIGNSSFTTDKPVGSFDVHYRILVMATRQIKWSDTVSIKAKDVNFAKAGKTATEQFNFLLNEMADLIANQLMENIYPISVVKIQSPKALILNQGGKSLKKGEVLDVFEIGDILKDEYTGESLGREESYVGQLTVKRVNAKTSSAFMKEGELDKSKKYICRREQKEETEDVDEVIGETEGFQPPF